jgi:hypothetical protein
MEINSRINDQDVQREALRVQSGICRDIVRVDTLYKKY